jgi:DNA-binding NarL/FixJ family response regulator
MENLESIVEQQATRIRALVHSRVAAEDYQDVMQDIRLAFLVALPKYNGSNGAHLETYAHNIARNKIAGYWRRVYQRRKLTAALIENYRNPPEISVVPEPKSPDLKFLSPAEKDVFRLIGMGLDNMEIAQTRFTSHETTRSHVKAVYKKLGCRDRVKVALMARKIFMEDDNGDKDKNNCPECVASGR